MSDVGGTWAAPTSRDVGGGPPKGGGPPAYVVHCRAVDRNNADELPGGARRLTEKPGDGWTATATFAAGVVETKAGETPMHSTAVRLRHVAGHRAVAWWTNGKPDAGAYRPVGWPWWQPCGVADVARVVKLASPAKRRRGEPAPADPFEVEPLDDPVDEELAP